MGFQRRVRLWESSRAQGFRGASDYTVLGGGGLGAFAGFQISVSVSFRGGGRCWGDVYEPGLKVGLSRLLLLSCFIAPSPPKPLRSLQISLQQPLKLNPEPPS